MNGDVFLAVLREHFPDAEIPEHEDLFTNEFIDDPSNLPVADHDEQLSALKAVEHHLRCARAAYKSLHHSVRAQLDNQFMENSVNRHSFARGTTLIVEGDPVKKGGRLATILNASLYSLTGEAPDVWTGKTRVNQPSALAAARCRVKDLVNEEPQTRGAQTTSKVALVQHAIWCWIKYGDGEPRLSSTKFHAFVEALSNALDPDGKRQWDGANLVRSYRAYIKRIDT